MARSTILALTTTMLALAVAPSCRNGAPSEEKTCAGAQALDALVALRGGSLPSKTLSLTFDDGPGARTLELSSYLKTQGIRAAFFVNGKNVADASVLAQLVADGHVLANHTQTHRSLTGQATHSPRPSDADVLSEIAQTDTLIAPFVPSARFMFRPPYGDYDDQTNTTVQATPMKKYVAPVLWDIGSRMGPAQATDWDCWQPGTDGKVYSVTACGDLYMQEIDTVGRGIVLLHDPYFIGGDPAQGGTVDMIKYIVPKLVAKGYAFARVDEVPDIAALLPPLPPAADAGAASPDASASTPGPSAPSASATPSASAPSLEHGPNSASGDNPDPCPRSPQDFR